MTGRVSIALDAMSGDMGPTEIVPAAITALETAPELTILLVGDQAQLSLLLRENPFPGRLTIRHAPDIVRMDDRPSYVLRKKQSSSMAVALSLVREGLADACVSGGNTGALMVLSRSILRTFPGIERPAIVKRIPSPVGGCYVLDLGANVDCSAENLYQFSLMGSVLAEAMDQKPHPRVALLNVGQEEIKGNEQVRLAAAMLKDQGQVNYIGFVEGTDIFTGVADVIVCDGFVGNVALKTGEGVAAMLHLLLRRAFSKSLFSRLLGWACAPVLRPLLQLFDPERHNGASFIGLQGVVVKSHGAARREGIVSALMLAMQEARMDVPRRIGDRVESMVF